MAMMRMKVAWGEAMSEKMIFGLWSLLLNSEYTVGTLLGITVSADPLQSRVLAKLLERLRGQLGTILHQGQ